MPFLRGKIGREDRRAGFQHAFQVGIDILHHMADFLAEVGDDVLLLTLRQTDGCEYASILDREQHRAMLAILDASAN